MDAEQLKLVAELPEKKSQRLDHFLSLQLKNHSRAFIQKLCVAGQILVNGETASPAYRLKGGESILITVPPPHLLQPEEIPLQIIYEDEYLAVINKPAGLVTHPGAGIDQGTLVNALLHHYQGKLSSLSGINRPGIVHRLDKDTSGLLVIAKDDKTHQGLSDQMKSRKVHRVYTAHLEGIMPQDEGVIDKPIGRHPVRRKEMAIVQQGKKAISHFKVIKRFLKFTLVEVNLQTGRTHQIRVHMAHCGFPVVADLIYNHKTTGTISARRKLGLSGQALHARNLSFHHPITGKLLEFAVALPPDFQQLLDSLEKSECRPV